MSTMQGFVYISGDPYLYQENGGTYPSSAALGVDSADGGKWKINISSSPGAAPGVGFTALDIDPVTGNITLTPLGGGVVTVAGPLSISGSIIQAGNIVTTNTAASSSGNAVEIEKSRSGGAITSGDTLGSFQFLGNDGTSYVLASKITSVNNGTIATGRIGSDLEFWTHPDSTTASTQRVVVASTGAVTINAPDSGTALTITAGGQTITAGGLTITAGGASITGTYTVNTTGSAVITLGTGGTGAVNIGNATGNTAVTGSLTASTGLVATTGGVTASAGGAAITGTTTINNSGSAVTTIGTGGTGAVTIGNATGNTAVTGSLTATTTLTGSTIYASGDAGGVTSQTAISNVTNTTQSTGTLSIKSASTNSGNNTGFIKAYVGATAVYIPYFTTVAP